MQQPNFEAALTLLEGQGAVSSDTTVMVKKLYQDLHKSDRERATCTATTETQADSDETSCGESSDDEMSMRASSGGEHDALCKADAPRKKFKPSSSKRQQLSDQEAVEIFQMRPRPKKGMPLQRGSMLQCKIIAPKYGVSAKTIRDIWSGRTWLHATQHLLTEEEKRAKCRKSEAGNRSPTNACGQAKDLAQATQFSAMPASMPQMHNSHYNMALTIPSIGAAMGGSWAQNFGGISPAASALPSCSPCPTPSFGALPAATAWLGFYNFNTTRMCLHLTSEEEGQTWDMVCKHILLLLLPKKK